MAKKKRTAARLTGARAQESCELVTATIYEILANEDNHYEWDDTGAIHKILVALRPLNQVRFELQHSMDTGRQDAYLSITDDGGETTLYARLMRKESEARFSLMNCDARVGLTPNVLAKLLRGIQAQLLEECRCEQLVAAEQERRSLSTVSEVLNSTLRLLDK